MLHTGPCCPQVFHCVMSLIGVGVDSQTAEHRSIPSAALECECLQVIRMVHNLTLGAEHVHTWGWLIGTTNLAAISAGKHERRQTARTPCA